MSQKYDEMVDALRNMSALNRLERLRVALELLTVKITDPDALMNPDPEKIKIQQDQVRLLGSQIRSYEKLAVLEAAEEKRQEALWAPEKKSEKDGVRKREKKYAPAGAVAAKKNPLPIASAQEATESSEKNPGIIPPPPFPITKTPLEALGLAALYKKQEDLDLMQENVAQLIAEKKSGTAIPPDALPKTALPLETGARVIAAA